METALAAPLHKMAAGQRAGSTMAASSLWQRYSTGRSKQAVKLVVLLACTVVVVIQLSECFSKLMHPPVSTHSRIVLNSSLTYPAITVCRSPPYRTSVLQKYNLGSSIRWTSEWDNFPYDTVSLSQFWDEATYRLNETIPVYGIQNAPKLIAVESSNSFLSGRCHTLKPLIQTQSAGSQVGYSLMLNHGCSEQTSSQRTMGWNVYIHEASEAWTESGSLSSGRLESLYLEVGEELQVKVGIQEFHRLNQPANPCNNNRSYSISMCEALCHWNSLAQSVGCSAPWLEGVNMSHCKDAASHKKLMISYLNTECASPCCNCIQPCHTAQYTASIVNRKTFQATTIRNHTLSQLYVFFTSKMVSVIDERYAYDWSLFIADLGGSLGFLLGLSVLGVIGIIERIVEVLLKCIKMTDKIEPLRLSESDTLRMTKDQEQTIQCINLNKKNYEVGGVTYKY